MANQEENAKLFAKQAAISFYEGFEKECENTPELNFKLFESILEDNKDTEYGKKYHFGEIKSYEDFKKYVPIINYSNVSEYIDKIANGEQNVLTKEPVNHLNLTSGTIGKQKRIPMTQKMMESFYRYDKLYSDGMLFKLTGDEWTKGRTFAGVQGWMERLPSGITVGDAEAVMADVVAGGIEEFNKQMSAFFTSPAEALVCDKNLINFKYIHCLFALMDKNIRGIVFGYFGPFVDYLHYIYLNYKVFIKDIRNGKINSKILIDDKSRKSIENRMKPNPERADELEKIFENLEDSKFVKKVWPHLVYVRGVGGASFNIFTQRLKSEFIGEDVHYILSGITASEGLFSVPYKENCEDSVIVPNCVFFEFLPVDADDDFSKLVTVDKVEKGKTYELIITNLAGLYRYRIGDCVKIVDFYKKSPIVRYSHRTTNVINLCAEKTTEASLCKAFMDANAELGYPFTEFTVAANTHDIPSHYDVFLQEKDDIGKYTRKHVEEVFEKHLCIQNEEYKDTVGDDFEHLKVLYLPPNATELFTEMRVQQGAPAMQCKQIHILKTNEQKFFFYYLSDLYEDKWHHNFVYTLFSFNNKIDRRKALLYKASHRISKAKNKEKHLEAFASE